MLSEEVLENGVFQPQIINLNGRGQQWTMAYLQRNSSHSLLVRVMFRHENRSRLLAEENNFLNRPEQNTEFVVV